MDTCQGLMSKMMERLCHGTPKTLQLKRQSSITRNKVRMK